MEVSRKIEDLTPLLQDKANDFLRKCALKGHSVIVTSTLRTYPEQEELYGQGRSKPGKIVTNARGGYSAHNFGLAFDVAFVENGHATWDGDWQALGAIGRSCGLEWGGDWKSFKDLPHFQDLGDKTLAQLRAEHDSKQV